MADRDVTTVLEPADEYPHVPDAVANYNESMYLNGFDLGEEIGGWFRLGNRVNEGYAEMTVCLYLSGGRVGFMYGRPQISTNDEMRAGGLHIEVVEPFEHVRVTYEGTVVLLDDPAQMADPRRAFRDNPQVAAGADLSWHGVSPMYGGRFVTPDGHDLVDDAETSFYKAHYEQHCAVGGTIVVGDESLTIEGLGLRDKSWGPRYWQALSWYRWLPMVFGDDFAMMISLIGGGDGEPPRMGGMVLEGDEYHVITECSIDSEWDDHGYQTSLLATARTAHDAYEVSGEVLSLIPLRNRRVSSDGAALTTRITEAMTRYECRGRRGIGMSEYLDQIVDGRPVGPDIG